MAFFDAEAICYAEVSVIEFTPSAFAVVVGTLATLKRKSRGFPIGSLWCVLCLIFGAENNVKKKP